MQCQLVAKMNKPAKGKLKKTHQLLGSPKLIGGLKSPHMA